MMSLLLLRASHVAPDPRVARAASVAEAAGLHTTVLAWDRDGGLDAESRLGRSTVVRYKRPAAHGRGAANLVGLALFQLYLVREVIRRRKGLSAIHACDLSTGLTGLVMARLLRVPLIYDIFDYFADGFPVPARALPWVRRVETFVIEHADTTILPTATRTRQIEPARTRSLVIVENSPDIATPPTDLLPTTDLAYVGILAPHRLLVEVVKLVAADPGLSIRIAGFGPLEDEIAELSEQAANVDFVGKVSHAEALQIQASARVLFATYDPSLRNHRYSAANKLGEALALGRPIIVCRSTSMDVQVQDYDVGAVVDYDVRSFERALRSTLEDDELLARCRERGPALYDEHHSWRVSAERLAAVYQALRERRS